MVTKMKKTELADDQALATLVVGTTYFYKNIGFKYNEPKPVSLALAAELEALTIGSTDSRSKTRLAQSRFEIEYPEGYTGPEPDEDEEVEEDAASSGAKRPAKKIVARKPSRASRT